MKKVIFICTHNSARSQMAEGLLRFMLGNKYECFSAGTDATSVNPNAIEIMEEIGIDIASQKSEDARKYIGQEFDIVVTVCDNAKESCPFFPGAKKYIHKSFEDPASEIGTSEEKLMIFRKIRDQIKHWLSKNF
ncbi:MAG: arsenate reductase ArsC [Planctomycetes bacterium]|nr:arsenate reductase ArsC [Planctomycetota bacterium]